MGRNLKAAIAPLQLPKHSFLSHAETQRTRRKDRSFSPASFFNEPRRHEEHEGRREERVIA
ncbi:MAG: hypothetical protein RLZZ507_2499 [Cyanobacteriota bacterium]|jgi:hypothetical protein